MFKQSEEAFSEKHKPDATTILTKIGPFGPGKVAQVYAGKDMVALNTLCCDLIKVNPREVLHI